MTRTVPAQDLAFNFKAPNDDILIHIYEHFISIGNNAKDDIKSYYKQLPGRRWYSDMEFLIEKCGREAYRHHVKESLNGLIKLQRAHNQIEEYMKQDRKSSLHRYTRDYIDNSSYGSINEPPTHYYFYYSEKGRYLKGMILSIICIPDPELLSLLEIFALECPFQFASTSQAPTGLYVYDALETFTQIHYKKGVPSIINMKLKIRGTWAQNRFAAALDKIAKLNGISLEELKLRVKQ